MENTYDRVTMTIRTQIFARVPCQLLLCGFRASDFWGSVGVEKLQLLGLVGVQGLGLGFRVWGLGFRVWFWDVKWLLLKMATLSN